MAWQLIISFAALALVNGRHHHHHAANHTDEPPTPQAANVTEGPNVTANSTKAPNVSETSAPKSHDHSMRTHLKHGDLSTHAHKHGAAPKKEVGSGCALSGDLSTEFSHTLHICKASQPHLRDSPRQEFLRVKSADECAQACKTFDPIFGCKGFTYSAVWEKCFIISSKTTLLNRAGYEAMCTGNEPYKHCTSLSVSQEKLPAEDDLPLSPSWPTISGKNMTIHRVGCDPVERFGARLISFKKQGWLSSAECSQMCLHYKPCAGSVFRNGECLLFNHFRWSAKCEASAGHRIYLRHCLEDGQQGPCACGDTKNFCKKHETCKNDNGTWGCAYVKGNTVEDPNDGAESEESKSEVNSHLGKSDDLQRKSIISVAAMFAIFVLIAGFAYCIKTQRKNNRPVELVEERSPRQVDITIESI
eukprot:GEMP01036892.1.p1 GENE.GEMP01036892.1~~GEMP01036892.1.p1  ORF type:complete len:417 (+),score=68.98 GEMP01036892.1:80-1330(+)